MFSGLAAAALIWLVLRRKFLGGELGGPAGGALGRIVTAVVFIGMWGTYILISSLKIDGYFD